MLTQRRIFLFWLPLAASWALMLLEGPTIQATIARMPNAQTMLAAAGIVLSLAVTIESPVIMLLATSTALAASPQAYRVLRRFVWHLNIFLTIVAAAMAFVDPIYNGLVPGLMGIPPHIAEAAQPAMKIMTFWAAAIGWRRFRQGILIRFDQTRSVGIGTGVRLVTVIAAAVAFVNFSAWPGVIAGACIWMAGVLSEMIYSHFASHPVVRDHLSRPNNPGEPVLSYREVARFHLPLAATALLTLLAQPLIGAGLARMPNPEENLAAWPIIFSVWLFFRSFGFALPETVVALYKGPQTLPPLRKFSLRVSVASSLLLGLVVFSPLISFYLLYVTGVTPDLTQFIIPGAMVGLCLPVLHGVQSWLRGVLMVAKTTGDIYWGMGVNLIVTGLVLIGGVWQQTPGAAAAAVALTAGMVAEAIYLWWRVKPAQTRLQLIAELVAAA